MQTPAHHIHLPLTGSDMLWPLTPVFPPDCVSPGGNQVARTIRGAHEGAVFTLMVDKAGNIISGGRDGKIVQWDRNLARTGNVLEVS